MDRKEFIKISTLSGALVGGGLLSGCKTNDEDRTSTTINSGGDVGDFVLREQTVADLRLAMEKGQLRSKDITQLYLKRIEQIDKNGPVLNAILELNPDALSIAERLDQEREQGNVRGPLHGIPVVLKDNIETSDKMKTTTGALALAENNPATDSWLAQKLRENGAVILAKANLSEWANFRSTRSSSGWSTLGGQTRNPYVLDRSPCGSSAGSGVAVSANLCALAIGTETNGSVVCPSSANGVVGIKPTLGLWSRSGIIPLAHSQDTAGPMARTVTDAAILLGALTGVDEKDPITGQSNGHSYTNYTQFLDKDGLQGQRIGVARNYFGFHKETDEVMNQAIETMEKAGAVIIDPISLEPDEPWGQAGFDVLLYEFKNDLNAYLETVSPEVEVETLEDIIAFNKDHAEETMPYFGQEILEMAQEKGSLSEPEYQEALTKIRRLSREKGIDNVMKEHQLDAIVAPTGGPAWPIDLVNGDHFGGGSSSMAARAGYPNITVPAGYIHHLPVSISIFGTAWSEPELLRIAYSFEQYSKVRKPPSFKPNIGLPG